MKPTAAKLLEQARTAEAAGQPLSRSLVTGLVEGVFTSEISPDDFEQWLAQTANRLPTAAELAGVVDALRQRMQPLAVSVGGPIVDTCGTGGDGSGTFNISTAAALVAAAAGLSVAKHGNRAVSSKTGSADVLEKLGVFVEAAPEVTRACLEQVGICFCFAPAHHPAMAKVGPIRRRIRRPTVFNLVGPLCNPAGAAVQVIGVGRSGAEEIMAEAARLIGLTRAVIVCSEDGVDEVGLFAPTRVLDVTAAGVNHSQWKPEDFGLSTASESARSDLLVADSTGSAACIRRVLAGEPGPRRDIVVLNAAAILWASEKASDLPAARLLAEKAIDSGAAEATLTRLVDCSRTVVS